VSLESTVGVAKVGTKSLRATVPEGIVAFLGIKEGDKLEWKMDVQKNQSLVLVKKEGAERLIDVNN
jgi:bifunctional DNA-binding transcriptional regulator/antitoxin component of YhaV-PrlF toxin-antitoxin module